MIIYLKVLLLSFVQALTEFIPVSSTAHLIIFEKYLDFNNNDGNLFEIFIQLASTVAICIFYRKKIFNVLFTLNKVDSQKFALKFFLAFLPCAFIGLFFYKYIKMYLYNDLFIAISLIIGGIILFIIDEFNIKRKYNNLDNVDITTSFKIGMYQIISILPGVSRSGSTIVGGIVSGLSRKTSVEFSFMLAIPTILGATLFEAIKNVNYLNSNNIGIILFGFFCTLFFSLFVIKFFLDYISNNGFKLFGIYRIIFGIIIIILMLC